MIKIIISLIIGWITGFIIGWFYCWNSKQITQLRENANEIKWKKSKK